MVKSSSNKSSASFNLSNGKSQHYDAKEPLISRKSEQERRTSKKVGEVGIKLEFTGRGHHTNRQQNKFIDDWID